MGVLALAGLSPLPAWTEEMPAAVAGPEVLPTASSKQGNPLESPSLTASSEPEAFGSQSPVPGPTVGEHDRSPLDDPWSGRATRQNPELEHPSGTCDPWSATRCLEELSDPWASDTLSLGPSTHDSEPAVAPAPPAPDLRLLLRSEEVLVEVGVDWDKGDVDSSCVPKTAEVRVRGLVGQTRVSGHHVGTVNSLDAWVIDLGAPEEPYE